MKTSTQHIHILGICGTFMAGIAMLAKSMGYHVTGSDANVYPPMSTQLADAGIDVFSPYSADNLSDKPDIVVVGNAIKRGNPELEAVLNEGMNYLSGPRWLLDYVLRGRQVLAVAGTHGKTTTSSMLAWVLDYAGFNPGFLIGGIPNNLGVSSRLGEAPYFVIEADEYDSAYFDKRSKFIHYHPNILVLNNLEFDHADIFQNLDEIKKQFNHLVRTIPQNGAIISNAQEKNLDDVLAKECYTPITYFNSDKAWHVELINQDGSEFKVFKASELYGEVKWSLLGEHNVSNALAAIAVADHLNIEPKKVIEALECFESVKRRLEIKGQFNGATLYDDFAHHPTAIKKTVEGLRQHVGKEKLLAVLELGSYTMRSGCHQPETFCEALEQADEIYLKNKNGTGDWMKSLAEKIAQPVKVFDDTDKLVADLKSVAKPNEHVLVMSNTGFDGFFEKLAACRPGAREARTRDPASF